MQRKARLAIALTEIVWRSIVAGFLFGNATQTFAQVDQRQELLRKTYELYGQGKYREAIPLAQQLVELDQKDLGSEDPDTATALNNLAELYRLAGDYAKAEPFCSEALRIREKVLGHEALGTALSLNNMALIYKDIGNYAKAEPLFSRALRIRRDILGPENPDTVQTLSNLALLYLANGDYSKAEPLLTQALQIREKVLGPEHPDTANSLNNLASLYEIIGSYTKAEPLYQRALQIREKSLGPDNPLTAASLSNLGALCHAMGNYSQAQTFFEQALQIRQKALGPEHPDTAETLNNLAENYRSMGKYGEAEALFQQAVQITQMAFGEEHPRTATVLSNLGGVYEDIGDYKKAESLFQEVLRIQRKVLGEEHPDTARTLNNLGDIYRVTGEYAKAESLFNQALQIMEKAFGLTHPVIAQSLNNLAGLYLAMGNYGQAEPLYKRALEIRQNVLGPEHSDTAQTLDGLATLYQRIGDYSKAVPLFQRALLIRQKVLGAEHFDTAQSLNNLALCYVATSDFKSAKPLYEEALKIVQKLFGTGHRETATSLNNLAGLYQALGEYDKAEPLYQEALQISDKVLGHDHPNTVGTVNNFAYLKLDIGKLDEAKLLAKRSYDSSLGTLSKILSFTSEQQRLAYEADVMPYTLFAALNGSSDLLANAVIHYKGVVLDSIIEDRLTAEHASERESIERLAADKMELGQLLLQSSSGSRSPEDAGVSIQNLEQDVDRIEGQLAQQVTALRGTRRAVTVALERVQAAIPKDAALIEYVRYIHYLGKGHFEPRYGTILLLPKDEPRWISLGNAEKIDAAVNRIKSVSSRGVDDEELQAKLQTLYESVLAPLQQVLPTQTRRMIICPDGQLNFLSFATLLDSQKHFLAERYTLEYVASGRDLLHETQLIANSQVVVFANPDFDLTTAKMSAQIDPSSSSLGPSALRGNEQRDLTEYSFSPLKGTQKESDALTRKFKEWDCQVVNFTGDQATKQALLKEVHSPYILHIATHGFFDRQSSPSQSAPDALFSLAQPNVGTSKFFDNPMHRSGLALAGAQTTIEAWKRDEVPPVENDGILTAEDVSTLDLQGTWLVTLSACDTGSGEARAGEGVMGLRRGFIQAGAQNLLMTLWPISDEVTVQIMSDFYDAAHNTGNAPEALADVQRKWLLKLRTEKGLAQAVNLAGPFIMSSQGKP
jgi:tetratricopeptide (TPR) repeat protein